MRRPITIAALALSALALAAASASAAPPTVSFGSATPEYVSAQVSGSINPSDNRTGWNFQYSTNPAVEGWIDGPGWLEQFIEAGAPTTPVSENLHGVPGSCCPTFGVPLTPGTNYKVRLKATNVEGEFFSSVSEFTTLPVAAPTIVSIAGASNIGNYSADVSASVTRAVGTDPAFNVECRFEYISDAGYQPRNEKQQLRVRATGGTYTLSFGGQTTAPIAYNASAATVQAALQALAPIGAGGVTVSGGPGSASGAFPYAVVFTGPLAVKDVEQITGDGSNLVEPGENAPELTTVTEGHPEGFDGGSVAPCDINPIKDPGTAPATGKLTGLSAKTTYHLRLTVSNAGGTDSEAAPNFTTTGSPVVQTQSASDVRDTSATLGGKVNPIEGPVTYQFQWGVDAGGNDETYENTAPLEPEALPFEDQTLHVVTTPLSELEPATNYHFRIVAKNTLTGEETFGVGRVFTTRPTPVPPEPCPNEASRVGLSGALPDCRVYEYATPHLNGSAPVIWPGYETKGVAPDGSAVAWGGADAPDNAEGSTSVTNTMVGLRSPDGVWESKSLSAGTPEASGTYFGLNWSTVGTSEDLRQSLVWMNQKLTPDAPSGTNLYLRRADGSLQVLTRIGAPTYGYGGELVAASKDFTRLFIVSTVRQYETDPEVALNPYEWSNGELKLVTILPGGEAAPQGGGLPTNRASMKLVSDDGSRVLFNATGLPDLYLRIDAKETVNVSASQRSPKDPKPVSTTASAGISADGSEVVFTSRSELTEDANTGETGGEKTDAGSDLYSYDVASKVLTDLTVDDKPADKATGANVEHVLGGSADASYLYFVATGDLAPGATSGARNLYVEHEGTIDFVATNPVGSFEQGYPFYVTPSGKHAAFMTNESETGYDNAGHTEVYKYTYGGALECASCRPNGELPTGDASIVGRAISADGSRVFYQSTDAVLPQASSGLSNVFEYEEGEVHLLTPGNGALALLSGASESGDDVFIATFEELAHGEGPVFAQYDARVNAEVAPPTTSNVCQGENCRGAPTAAPVVPTAGSASFEANGKVTVFGAQSVRGSKAELRVVAPGAGEISIAGQGLKPVKKQVSGAGSVTVTLTLKSSAGKKLRRKGIFRTKPEILFRSSGGSTSRADFAVKFTAAAAKKGGGK